jgi:hypothetical protein
MRKRWSADRTNKAEARFLQLDSEIALTFSAIALEARDLERRRRTTRAAHRAYDTITRLRAGIKLTDTQKHRLDANLRRLKSELEKLGERF